jgi:hypothetical protein
MTQIAFDYNRETTVPIPDAAGDEQWIDEPVAVLAATHELSPDETETIRAALLLAAGSNDPGLRMGIFEPSTRAFAVLRALMIERELTSAEQEDFLHPPSVLPPQIWMTPKTSFGVGCSSIVLEDATTGQSSVRWLFVPEGATVIASLGAVPSRAVVLIGMLAEQILQTMRVEGLADRMAAGFDPAALVARNDPDGRTWQT